MRFARPFGGEDVSGGADVLAFVEHAQGGLAEFHTPWSGLGLAEVERAVADLGPLQAEDFARPAPCQQEQKDDVCCVTLSSRCFVQCGNEVCDLLGVQHPPDCAPFVAPDQAGGVWQIGGQQFLVSVLSPVEDGDEVSEGLVGPAG